MKELANELRVAEEEKEAKLKLLKRSSLILHLYRIVEFGAEKKEYEWHAEEERLLDVQPTKESMVEIKHAPLFKREKELVVKIPKDIFMNGSDTAIESYFSKRKESRSNLESIIWMYRQLESPEKESLKKHIAEDKQ